MNSELIEQSKYCHSCLDWHEHCKAECCQTIQIGVNPSELNTAGRYMDIRKILSQDEKFYYRLRRVPYIHGYLRFDKKKCIVSKGRVIYIQPCEFLNDYKCINHEGNRPEMCRVLNVDTDFNKYDNIHYTDNCLYKYKMENKL